MHIQIPCSCQTVHVEVRLLREDSKPYLNVPMAKTAATELYETWTAAFALDDPDLYFYFFQITTKNESFRLLKQGDDTNMEDGDWWQISVIAEEFAVPSALEGAVMYQIFPDRFAKSGQADLHDKLQPYWIHSNTHDIPVWQPNERGEVTNNDFSAAISPACAKSWIICMISVSRCSTSTRSSWPGRHTGTTRMTMPASTRCSAQRTISGTSATRRTSAA